jgi:hypothetical protein
VLAKKDFSLSLEMTGFFNFLRDHQRWGKEFWRLIGQV